MKHQYYCEFVYKDGSEFGFEVTIEGDPVKLHANLSMVVRGTLMATSAIRAAAYDSEGFVVCAYCR